MKKPIKLHMGYKSKSYILVDRAEDKVRPNGKKRPVWNCRCEQCGAERKIESQLIASSTHSECCCISSKLPQQNKSRGGATTKYRGEYNSYRHMLGRCYDEREEGYENYGGRGITVCDSWREDFRNFIEDMGERPEKFVLDRIDPDGNYCPENCRWVDRNISSYNTRKASNNTSGRTGVYWFERVGKWVAAIHVKGEQIHLGYFLDFEDAVKAREDAEIKYYGVNKE